MFVLRNPIYRSIFLLINNLIFPRENPGLGTPWRWFQCQHHEISGHALTPCFGGSGRVGISEWWQELEVQWRTEAARNHAGIGCWHALLWLVCCGAHRPVRSTLPGEIVWSKCRVYIFPGWRWHRSRPSPDQGEWACRHPRWFLPGMHCEPFGGRDTQAKRWGNPMATVTATAERLLLDDSWPISSSLGSIICCRILP